MRFFPKSHVARALFNEAFDMSRKAVGEIPFKSSSVNDPHIADLIKDAANKMGIPAAEIMAKLKKDIDKIEEFKKYSYVLYDTMAKNAVETAAFELIEHSKMASKVKFDIPTFMKLIKMVELEHEQFFPLRAPGEANYIFHIQPILVPDKKPDKAKFNGIETAAATPDGDFIFNREFMQKLIDWATIERLQPKGKKYKVNGGPIPDQYAYIEFVIVHELLHYSYGDFTTGTRLSQYSRQIHNWAMDFRSNYMLVKNGYDQLPIGLFSDHINYDRQGRYDAMVKLVHDEMKKLPDPLKDLFNKLSQMDQHPDGGDGGDGQGGDGKGDQPNYVPKVGDTVKNNTTGELGRITAVNADGSVEVEAVPAGSSK